MLMKISILIFISSLTFANSKPNDIDKDIMHLGLNYQFEEAHDLLDREFNDLENLKKHFLFLNIELLKVIKATDEAPHGQRREVKDSLNNVLIEYAEKIVEQYEDEELSIYDKFYFGSIHGLLGRFYGVSREMMSAFSSGKEGRNLMEEVIEEDPNFVDAYLLLGMMNYYADRLGGFIEFVAGILGLSGDRSIGLEYLEKVEKEGYINNWQATMILIELYSRMEGNKFASLPLLEKIVKRFPNNSKFKNWLCYEYLNLHQLNELELLISDDSSGLINDFIKASFYHQAGEYDKSNDIYDELLSDERTTRPWVYRNAKYTRVLNYFLLGNEKKANELSEDLNEEYALRYKEILENPEVNYNLAKLRLAVSIDDQSSISKIIENKQQFESSKRMEATYYYYLGVNLFNQNKLGEAEKHFLRSKELNFDEYGSLSAKYLIHIYLMELVEIEKVENLMDDIDELDNDGLEFFAQDLEKKYDL